MSRTINLSPSSVEMKMRIAPDHVSIRMLGEGAEIKRENGYHLLRILPEKRVRIKLMLAAPNIDLEQLDASPPEDLEKYTNGGPNHYPEVLQTPIIPGNEEDAYAEDVFVLPIENPWKS